MFPRIDEKGGIEIFYFEDGCGGLARKPGLVGNFKPGLKAPGVVNFYFTGDTFIGREIVANCADRSSMKGAETFLMELRK